jgi:hypothetical protein
MKEIMDQDDGERHLKLLLAILAAGEFLGFASVIIYWLLRN